MKSAMLGLGKSGRSVIHYLLKQGQSVVGIDQEEKIQALQKEFSIPIFSEEAFTFDGIDRLIVSPGISANHPIYAKAKKIELEITSDMELALESIKCPLIGVTGTNGKTTTVERIAHVLRFAGYDSTAVGNNGNPILDYVDADKNAILVVEISSFQLELLHKKNFTCSVILNITPDHLERYGSFEVYAATKRRLIDLTLGPTFLPPFSNMQRQNLGGEKDNIAAAYLICKEFGVSESLFFTALNTFKRPPHRLEFVKKVDQISFYNDSKGTNVDSVIYAIKAIEGPKVLIVGGKDKGLDFSVWQKEFDDSVETIIAFGEAKEKIQKELNPRFSVCLTKHLEEAVHLAFKMAKKTVLLSPGCSSYDQFKNFEERGNCFKKIVEEL